MIYSSSSSSGGIPLLNRERRLSAVQGAECWALAQAVRVYRLSGWKVYSSSSNGVSLVRQEHR
jgi:hypothetical protein